MYRFLSLIVFASLLPAQTPNLDKPPQDVDDALRGRIKQFYDLHVAGKYRQAEQVVAEESKDDFYVLSKPDLKAYKIGNIEYSDKFTKAKVVIIGSMPIMLPMAAGKIMDMPFASYWKVENGIWCWYYNKEVSRNTPFGRVQEKPKTDSAPAPTSLPTAPDPQALMAQLQSALKIDRTRIEVTPTKPETIKVTNTLPGPASLSVACPYRPLSETGIIAKLDKKDLAGNETAVLTLSLTDDALPGTIPLIITVSPTNQVLNFYVTITR
jgi:hypothetical protein